MQVLLHFSACLSPLIPPEELLGLGHKPRRAALLPGRVWSGDAVRMGCAELHPTLLPLPPSSVGWFLSLFPLVSQPLGLPGVLVMLSLQPQSEADPKETKGTDPNPTARTAFSMSGSRDYRLDSPFSFFITCKTTFEIF